MQVPKNGIMVPIAEIHTNREDWYEREDIGIAETSYGIVTVPIDWVLSYLKDLHEKGR